MLSHSSRSSHSKVAAAMAVALASLVLFGCPKRQTTPVTVDGTPLPEEPKFEPKKDPAADEALAKAESQAAASSPEQAVEAYAGVRKAYPQSAAGQEALMTSRPPARASRRGGARRGDHGRPRPAQRAGPASQGTGLLPRRQPALD